VCRELHLDNIVTRGNVYFQISFLQIKDIYIYIICCVCFLFPYILRRVKIGGVLVSFYLFYHC